MYVHAFFTIALDAARIAGNDAVPACGNFQNGEIEFVASQSDGEIFIETVPGGLVRTIQFGQPFKADFDVSSETGGDDRRNLYLLSVTRQMAQGPRRDRSRP